MKNQSNSKAATLKAATLKDWFEKELSSEEMLKELRGQK